MAIQVSCLAETTRRSKIDFKGSFELIINLWVLKSDCLVCRFSSIALCCTSENWIHSPLPCSEYGFNPPPGFGSCRWHHLCHCHSKFQKQTSSPSQLWGSSMPFRTYLDLHLLFCCVNFATVTLGPVTKTYLHLPLPQHQTMTLLSPLLSLPQGKNRIDKFHCKVLTLKTDFTLSSPIVSVVSRHLPRFYVICFVCPIFATAFLGRTTNLTSPFPTLLWACFQGTFSFNLCLIFCLSRLCNYTLGPTTKSWLHPTLPHRGNGLKPPSGLSLGSASSIGRAAGAEKEGHKEDSRQWKRAEEEAGEVRVLHANCASVHGSNSWCECCRRWERWVGGGGENGQWRLNLGSGCVNTCSLRGGFVQIGPGCQRLCNRLLWSTQSQAD